MGTGIYDIAIIGAGASGLMAAIAAGNAARAAGRSLSIIVLEKNRDPGVKLLATGNGRCNYLNKNAAPSDFYCSSSVYDFKTVKSAKNCGPGATAPAPAAYEPPQAALNLIGPGSVDSLISDFRQLGIEPFEEDAGRLYPRSQQAASVVKALTAGARRAGAELLCGFDVYAVDRASEGFVITSSDCRKLRAEKVIAALGGKAGIQFGTCGDGYRIARSLGIKTEKAVPALTKLVAAESLKPLAGVRVRCHISLVETGSGTPKTAAEDRGELQFTEDCLSGICTFNISRFYRFFEGASYRAVIDLAEEYTLKELTELLQKRRSLFADEPAEMLLMGLLPAKLCSFIMEKAGLPVEKEPPADKRSVNPQKPLNSNANKISCRMLSTEAVENLAQLCKALEIPLAGTKSWKEAQVTAGGISLEELDQSTLEVKKLPGLYFAGEALDIDGPCGGYNLTWAFASGRAAGENAAKGFK